MKKEENLILWPLIGAHPVSPAPFGKVGRASSVRLRGKKVLFKGRLEGGMWWYHYRETMEEGGRQGARERSDSHDRQTYD